MHIHVTIHQQHHYPEIDKMSQQLDDLTREVQESKTAQEGAVTLIEGTRQQLMDMANNATELEDLKSQVATLAQELSDSTDALAAATATPPSE